MADLRISELPGLNGPSLDSSDLFPVTDLSASQTKKISAKDLVQYGVALIDAKSIPVDKFDIVLAAGSVGTLALANGSITAQKLADNSSGVIGGVLPAVGDAIGQIAVDTTNDTLHLWTGSAWLKVKAAGSVNDVKGTTSGLVLIGTTQSGDEVTVSASIAPSTGARQFLAGPTAGAGAYTSRQIIGTDLPIATNVSLGGVAAGPGLTVNAGGTLEIDNAVAIGSTRSLVTYDAKGLVQSGSPIQPSDLPAATAGAQGAVFPGPSLVVSGGQLDVSNRITPGTYAKVTVDTYGLVSAGAPLTSVDIPAIDASKITSGQLAAAQIGDRSITEPKLADYAIAYIQDTIPAAAGGSHHIGMLWLNPLAQQIRMWDGNVWVPIGVGALSEQNLRFCGLFDASTGKIAVVTKLGLDAGFKVGDTIPVTTEQLTGAYFVANTPGNGTAQTTGITYDNGDWIVSISVAQGWQRVDTLNSAGGGGGASTLDGLVDVTAPSPATGQALIFNGVNWGSSPLPVATAAAKGIIELATQAEVTTGTDTVRAVTPATLKGFVDAAVATGTAAATAPTGPASGQMWVDISKAPPVTNVWDGTKWVQVGATPADSSETVKGVVELATTAEVDAGTDTVRAVTPKTLADNYLAKNNANLAPLP